MRHGRERAVARGAEPHDLLRLGAVPDPAEHLRTRNHELYGTPREARGHRRERHVRPRLALAAECAADKGCDDADRFGIDAERRSEAVLNSKDPLRRVVDRQTVAGPLRDRGMRFHRVVVLGGRTVRLLQGHCGARKRVFRHAAFVLRRFAEDLVGEEALAGSECGRWWAHVVAHAHEPGGVGGLLEGLCDCDRHRLPVELDGVALQEE